MQKSLFFAPLLMVLVVSTFFYNCSEEEQGVAKDDSVTTLWSNATSATRSYASNDVEAHISLIQSIGPAHPAAEGFLSELTENNFSRDDLNVANIIRVIGTSTDVAVLSVCNEVTGEVFIAYQYGDEYCLIKTKQEGDVYTLCTIDDVPVQSFKIDETRIRLIDTQVDNKIIDYFSTKVQQIQGPVNITTPGCCRRQANFSGCTRCTYAYFSIPRNLVARGAMWYWAWPVMGALTGSCIGAGPSARC